MCAAPSGATLQTVAPPPDSQPLPAPPADDDERYTDWDAIYQDNVVRIYQMMHANVGNRPDAEHLTTEVFMAALKPLRTGGSRPEVRSYLAATAQSKLASFWRRRLGIEVTRIDHATAAHPRDEQSTQTDAGVRVRQILDGLPDRYRRILELRFLDARSISQAARAIGVSVANARVLQYQALCMAGRMSRPAEVAESD
jgi:RNA polymerase sigma factor (sigma-70 family)